MFILQKRTLMPNGWRLGREGCHVGQEAEITNAHCGTSIDLFLTRLGVIDGLEMSYCNPLSAGVVSLFV
jgi:hypothetical protein